MTGWLVAQLPRVLQQDRFTRRFVTVFEEIADGVRGEIDAVEYYFDVATAPAEFVQWLGGWLQVVIDPSMPEERQREVVRAAGDYYARRGTASGLQGFLEAVTRGEVRIVDGGGTWAVGAAPPNPGRILVRLTDTGEMLEEHLYRLIAAEIPIGVTFELRVDDRTIEPPTAPRGVEEVLSAARGGGASMTEGSATP
ncbi:MAG: phage tail protein [Dehalococcoidia bacterium]